MTDVKQPSPDPAADSAQGGPAGRAKLVLAAGGAALAGLAGGVAWAARDTRKRVMGMPLGRRNGLQKSVGTAVERVSGTARGLGQRLPARGN